MAAVNVFPTIYQPLRRDVQQIRLVTVGELRDGSGEIHCRLETVDLATAPPYFALSYVWGDPAIAAGIQLNGIPMQITTNLYSALRRLSSQAITRPVWIDAICINQCSVGEKNYQVPLMGKIYAQSQGVMIWLGEEDEDSDLGMDLFRRWGDGVSKAQATCRRELLSEPLGTVLRFIEDAFDERALIAANALLNRDYWRRVWIIQEVVLAPTRTVICGGKSVEFKSIYHAHNFWKDIPHLNNSNVIGCDTMFSTSEISSRSGIYNIQDLVLEKVASEKCGQLYRPNIFRLLECTWNSCCLDPRDRMYALLGFFDEDGLPMQPDYGLCFGETCLAFTTGLLQRPELLDIISLAGIGYNPKPDRRYPSWVPPYGKEPDNSANPHVGLLPPARWSFRATRGISLNCTLPSRMLLQVRSVICDEITDICNPKTIDSWHGDGDNPTFEWIWDWLSLASKIPNATKRFGMPWRQLFFRTLVVDHLGPSNPSFTNQERKEDFLREQETLLHRAEGFMTFMRWLAIEKVTCKMVKTADNIVDSEILLKCDATSLSGVQRLLQESHFDNETIYWLRNSSVTQDTNLRQRLLDSFCGPAGSTTRLELLSARYGCASVPADLHIFLVALRVTSYSYSFFTTRSGYMGLGPPYARKGDQICVVLGCSVPLVIRKDSENFLLVGDSYVYGIMQGEVMDAVQSGGLHVECLTFE